MSPLFWLQDTMVKLFSEPSIWDDKDQAQAQRYSCSSTKQSHKKYATPHPGVLTFRVWDNTHPVHLFLSRSASRFPSSPSSERIFLKYVDQRTHSMIPTTDTWLLTWRPCVLKARLTRLMHLHPTACCELISRQIEYPIEWLGGSKAGVHSLGNQLTYSVDLFEVKLLGY